MTRNAITLQSELTGYYAEGTPAIPTSCVQEVRGRHRRWYIPTRRKNRPPPPSTACPVLAPFLRLRI